METSDWCEEGLGETGQEDVGQCTFDITSTPNDFNVSTLYSLIDTGIIRLPPFQRNYVWDVKRASKLIESIILGLPVPQIFLYEIQRNTFYVIDGQQRLLSIFFFVKGRFPTDSGRVALRKHLTGEERISDEFLAKDEYFRNFSLKLPAYANGEQNRFNGLKYVTLNDEKHRFDFLRTIRSVVIKQNDPEDDSSMFEIFNRLNTGGLNLSPQEIRMSLYYSDFYKMLLSVNQNGSWRRFVGQVDPDIHFKDVEIILRCLALSLDYEAYNAPMTKFLNTFSKKAKEFSLEKVTEIKVLFESFLAFCSNINSDAFYAQNNKFSYSLFESVFVASCFISKRDGFQLSHRRLDEKSLIELKINEDFVNASQGAIASKANLTTRVETAKRVLRVLD